MSYKKRILILGIVVLTLLCLVGIAIGAEEYPTEMITIFCGYAPGGGADNQLRLLVPYLQKHLGKSIRIENLTGAGGMLATNKVFSSSPDGYTLLIQAGCVLALQEKYLPETCRYRTLELSHISSFTKEVHVVLSHPEVWKNFAEFSKAAQSKRLLMGFAGKGTMGHLSPVVLQDMMGVKFNMIPFESGGQAMTAVAGKHADAVTTYISTSIHLVRGGNLNPLLVMSNRRHFALPQTPIPEEVGLKLTTSLDVVMGIFGPPKLPADRVKILEEAMSKAVRDPEYQQKAKQMVVEIQYLNSQDHLANTVKEYSQIEKYLKVLQGS